LIRSRFPGHVVLAILLGPQASVRPTECNRARDAALSGYNEPGHFSLSYLDKGPRDSFMMGVPNREKAVARNLPPASLEVLAKPRFLPRFQRFREVLAELLGQRTEVISLPVSPRRAGTPARAAALSDWPFSHGLPRQCAGEAAVINHKSLLQTGTTRSRQGSPGGVTNDEAENTPRLRVTYGEDSKESKPPFTSPSRDTHRHNSG